VTNPLPSLARADRLGDAPAGLADELAELGLLLGRHVAQLRVERRERRGFPRVCRLGNLQRRGVGGSGERRERSIDSGIDGGLGDFARFRHRGKA